MPKRMIRNMLQGSVYPEFWYHNGLDRAVAVSNKYPIPVQLGDSPSIDPFGRQRISMPFTLFDSKQLWDKAPLFWDEQITNNSGNATSVHSTANARTRMTVDSNDVIIRQTFQRFNYQPGKGQRIEMTFNLNGGQTNVAKKVGIFDDNNGIFLMLNGTNLYFVVRKEGVADTEVVQQNWNLDTLDGNGESKIELDLSTVKIMIIDYEWLGVGRVRVGFIIGGQIIYCHEFLNSNVADSVYMSTPNLPLRYSIEAAAIGEVSTLDHICTAVSSEGGVEQTGKVFGANSGQLVQLGVAFTNYVMLAIRLMDTHHDLITEIIEFSTYSTSQGAHYVNLWLNPVLSSALTFSDYDATYSGVQIADPGNTITVTSGIRLYSDVVEGNSGSINVPKNKRQLGVNIAGTTRDVIAISIAPFTQNQNCAATLNWREQ